MKRSYSESPAAGLAPRSGRPVFRGAKSLAGHLDELRVARDPAHPSHINPHIRGCDRVLDVGCGAGQTLIAAACPGTPAVGIDVDLAALQLANSMAPNASFVCAAAELLPFADASFDLVISRVALPYTRISRSLSEIRRVLRPGGRFWAVLHPVSIPWKEAAGGNVKSYLYFLYVLVNSLVFHFGQAQFGFPGHGCESFQTRGGMRKALKAARFEDVSFPPGAQFLVEARAR